jgi:hypothetical protein
MCIVLTLAHVTDLGQQALPMDFGSFTARVVLKDGYSMDLLSHRYVNQPEPRLQGHSVTVKADEARVAHMRAQAQRTFTPELARLMQARALSRSFCFACMRGRSTCRSVAVPVSGAWRVVRGEAFRDWHRLQLHGVSAQILLRLKQADLAPIVETTF